MIRCKRCNKPLKNPVSIKYEMGPTCLEKELGIKPTRPVKARISGNYPQLFNLEEETNAKDSRNP